MLESYHVFITLRFHDSGDQESYVSFRKNIAYFGNYYYFLFSQLTFHANLSIRLYFTNKACHKSQPHCLPPTTNVILCEFHLTDL